MPRLRYIDEAEKTARDRKMIESAQRTGAPDPRVVSIMLRNPKTGAAWVEYWNKLGTTACCRTSSRRCVASRFPWRISAATARPYARTWLRRRASRKIWSRSCSTMRAASVSQNAKKRRYGMPTRSRRVNTRSDSDEIFAELRKHFSDQEIIELGLFCAETDGVGKFVKSLNVISWQEACDLNPNLRKIPTRKREPTSIEAA